MNVGVAYGALQVAQVGRVLRVGCTLQEVLHTSFLSLQQGHFAKTSSLILDYRLCEPTFVKRKLVVDNLHPSTNLEA